MSQKAASLTSSLFARKGKASPASLLISELAAAEGAAADPGADAQAGVERGRANGHNGAVRRKPKSKPAADLPLLAFVEARETTDPPAGEAPEPPKEAVAVAEPAPAASLLERGPRPLRRAGQRPAADPIDAENAAAIEAPAAEVPVTEAPATAIAMPPPAESTASPDDVIEAEIVSGDANVAAIEDAPQDADAPAEADPVAQASPHTAEPAAEAERAAAADTAAAPAAPAPGETEAEVPAATPNDAPPARPAAPTMPATLALRQAAARGRPAPAAARPQFTTTAPPPAPRRAAVAWRSAAVIALGAALGLGFYLVVAGKSAAPPVASSAPESAPLAQAAAPVPPAEAPAAPAPAASARPAPAEPAPAEPAESAGPATASVDLAEPAAPPEPSFDIIRIEPDGQSIIAGRAAPGSEWILLNNGEPIASVQADANGEWVVLPDSALVPGANAFSLVPKSERGRIDIPAPAAAPEAAAPAPALPRPKPLQAEAFRAADEGAYEVQLASVRQTADAERERRRLAAAFPRLLGDMALRVQEATLEGAGVFYRVRSGAIGELSLARDLCRRLEAEGQGCLVVRRPEAAPSSEVADDVPDAAAAVRQQAAERPR